MEQWRKQAAVQRECELELNAIMKQQAKLYDDYDAARAVILASRQALLDKMDSIQEAINNIYIQSQKII